MPQPPPPPSGRQFEIAHGDQRATVVEVGGGLREYRRGERDILDGYGLDEMCSSGRGQNLIPWPNRIRDGRYRFDGRDQQLARSEPEQGNAIHGLVRWSNWTATEHRPDRVRMAIVLHPQSGYPFALDLTNEYSLSEAGLTVTTTATNVGGEPCPFGAGAHPYIKAGADRIDGATLKIPADTWMDTDERQIPVSNEAVQGTEKDFRTPREIGDTRLDTAFTDLIRDADGRARVVLAGAGGEPEVAVWLDSAYGYVMAFTGDTLPDAERRRGGLGVEPMTCAPNAFASGDGLITLAPGESLTCAWGIEPGA